MIDLPGGPGFLLEAMHSAGIAGEPFGDHLHRDVAAQPRIARAVDVAHPAFAQLLQDLIWT